MLNKLAVIKYQSHSRSEVTFSRMFTAITGRSQSGKTGLLRALNWVVNGKPRGFRFNSNFTKDPTEVILDLDGNRKISHLKSKNKEVYTLDGKSDDYTGAQVPDKIESLLNFTEINMQSQLEEPFLITSSPGKITRVINKVTNLDKVDLWTSKITTKVNDTNKEIGFVKQEIKTKEDELLVYKGLETIERPLDQFERLSEKIEEDVFEIDEMYQIITDFEDVTLELNALQWVDEAVIALDQVSKLEKEILHLDDLLYTVEIVEELEQEIQCLDGIDELYEELIEIDEWLKEYERLQFLSRLVVISKKEINSYERTVEIAVGDYNKELKDQGICPTCFSLVTDKVMKKIQRELG